MRLTMKSIFNRVRARRIAASLALLFFIGPALWAGGRKDQIESVTAEGGEIWQNDFDVSMRKKGLYNIIVFGRDRADNETVSGPFNLKIDPNAGLPVARVVYPENNSIIRQNINILGVASGRFGVDNVMIRLDSDDWTDASGTEYWNKLLDFSGIPDGKHTLYVKALDSKDTSGPEIAVNFILDTSAPVIELTSHSIGDIVSGQITVKGTAGDPNGIKSLEYSEDGEKFKSLGSRKRGTGPVEFSIPVKTKNYPDGPLVYYIRAVDTTGAANAKPFLFFVSNNGPELEIYTPAAGEDVFGTFFLSGRAYAKIGIEKLYYEYGKIKEDIEIRAGDPFWGVSIQAAGASGSVKVTAQDKAGNITSVTRKLEDRRKVKGPVLVIDYPGDDLLRALPADTAIYGHIENAVGKSVQVDGIGELEAMPAFRIDPQQLPAVLKKTQTLKITPIADDNAKGAAVSLRFVKQETSMLGVSQVTVSSPEKYSWLSGSFTLQGRAQGGRLEYRLSPDDSWKPVSVDPGGSFEASVSISGQSQGPLHLELRTGADSLPIYHPLNVSASRPEIQFISPPADDNMVHGNKTVMGSVDHSVPISNIAYTLDGAEFEDIPFSSRSGKAWFGYFCNFTSLASTAGKLSFRVTDASGAYFDKAPDYVINPNPPLPTIIVNTPVDGEVFTGAFDISGVAFDDVGIEGVYWRILGPKPESISPGPAGREAMDAAEAFMENPDIPFRQLPTDQNFSIPVDFSMITDGEYNVEIYASDPYGVHSETVSRVIKISTLPPETRIMAPVITRYNQKAILMQGFSSDANGIDTVFISMDNGNIWQDVDLEDSGDWSISLNTVIYTDGIYSALIRTVDKYGISTFSNAMVNIDNTAPDLYLSSPANGQRIGTNLSLAGRVSDNIALKSLTFQIISAENPEYQRTFEIPPQLVIFENMSLDGFPQGEYIIRVVAKDLADNESIVSRKIVFDSDDKDAQVALFNPLPGQMHTGPINVVGTVTASVMPAQVQLMMNDRSLGLVDVDRYGIFRYEIDESMLPEEAAYKISAFYNSESGQQISSLSHTVYYSPYGPSLAIDSHKDGDVISRRPWLSGRAWITVPVPVEGERPSRQQRAEGNVKQILVSYDNGRSFRPATGGNEWKFRMETGILPSGPQPVVVRALFENGTEAVRRLLLTVDTTPPLVDTISPPENSVHRDNIRVFGTAGDNYELADVDLSLRPGDKFWYSVPGPLQGMYFDVKGLGATYFDVGIGLSLFNDNVRFQGQYGKAPPDGRPDGGRYTGDVFGIKLLANIFYLPFDYLFGPDWAFYSMNFAVGANFSWFAMDENRSALYMGAVVAQWDIANVDLSFFKPNWKYFRNYALYLQPEIWFASTDVEDATASKTILRMTVGLRINWF